MRFATFTRTIPVNAKVSINPMQVVAVETFNTHTNIHTAVARSEGNGFMVISVTENAAFVVSELQNAMNT